MKTWQTVRVISSIRLRHSLGGRNQNVALHCGPRSTIKTRLLWSAARQVPTWTTFAVLPTPPLKLINAITWLIWLPSGYVAVLNQTDLVPRDEQKIWGPLYPKRERLDFNVKGNRKVLCL